MEIEDKLKKCLCYEIHDILESAVESLIQEAISELVKYKKVTTGWNGYAWKNGEYIDNIQEYFDSKLKETNI